MPRYKPYSYEQIKLVLLDLTSVLEANTFEHAINYIVDNHLDLSIFDGRFKNDATGAPAYDPAIMLKIILYAYSRGITHSRDIANACAENVKFMALSADTRPHFTTIAAFIASMKDVVIPLFRDVVALCYSMNLIGKEMFAIDGCKISSNCSKEWSGTREEFESKKRKIEKSIAYLVGQHRIHDLHQSPSQVEKNRKKAIRSMREKINKITKWLKENPEDKKGVRGTVCKSNITDNESCKMPTSHGVVQGYTGVAVVDSKRQVIVHAEAFGEGQEKQLLKPVLEGTHETCREAGVSQEVLREAIVLADNGYHSNDNVAMCMKNGINAYLADGQFRKRDPRFKDSDKYRKSTDKNKAKYINKRFYREDFTLDKKNDVLICPAGKKLSCINKNFKNDTGLIGPQYRAHWKDCQGCVFRKKCLQGNSPRSVVLFNRRDKNVPETYTEKMIRKFDSPLGRQIYSKRMGIVEPVFAAMKNGCGLSWFTMRGKQKVNAQWMLHAIVHDISKLFRFAPKLLPA
jgi:transposase